MIKKLEKKIVSQKKRFITLIEMMIVMFLIALITGVVAYNYRGSLDEGKVFKTKQGMEKLEMILNLRVAENPELIDNLTSTWPEIIKHDPLVKDPNAIIKDGWGQQYEVSVENNIIKVRSPKYNEYKNSSRTRK